MGLCGNLGQKSWSTGLLAGLAIFSVGCQKGFNTPPASVTGSCQNRVSIYYNGVSERAYCSTPIVHAAPVAIDGTALYESRHYQDGVGLGPIVGGQAIRYAEVVARDPDGKIVQCGETDANGDFSLDLPTSNKTYTISVYSRGYNDSVKASVLNCPEEKIPYALSTTVIPDVAKNIGNITATAANSGDLIGAAFNIFDQFVTANKFFFDEIGNCSPAGCTDFTTAAPKVEAYWEKGFNPNDYYDDDSGLSFYVPGYYRLFILGGINGDILTSDTDHFDNSVILHEYGHFLEDVFTVADSPGGYHNGNGVIDPRLAWGEGWGNFIQAAIRGTPNYRDTVGTPGGVTSFTFDNDIETCVAAGCDVPAFDYEGNFREYSISRMLWDIFDGTTVADNDADGVDNEFAEVWYLMTWTNAFRNTLEAFRNIGLLHHKKINDLASNSWNALHTAHKHGDTAEYAQYVTASGACADFSLTPYDDPDDTGSFKTSHLLRNNDFYYYRHAGGAFNLSLSYQTTDPGGVESDLDLYLYNETARYGLAADVVNGSETWFDNDPTTDETESFSISHLPAGVYLINVKVYTGRYIGAPLNGLNSGDFIPAGTDLTYSLTLSGTKICPAARP